MIKKEDYKLLDVITSLKNEIKLSEDNSVNTNREILNIFYNLGLEDRRKSEDFADLYLSEGTYNIEENINDFLSHFYDSLIEEYNEEEIPSSFYEHWTDNDYYDKYFERFLSRIPNFIRDVLTKTTGIEENVKLGFILFINKLLCIYVVNNSFGQNIYKDRKVSINKDILHNALLVLNNVISKKLELSSDNQNKNNGVEGFCDETQIERRILDADESNPVNDRVEQFYRYEFDRNNVHVRERMQEEFRQHLSIDLVCEEEDN